MSQDLCELAFPGVTVTVDPQAIAICSERPLRTLSSAVIGGGFVDTQYILNRHVDKAYDRPDPVDDLRSFACQRGVDEPFVGLMTAVRLREARAVVLNEADLTVAAIVTAGTRNATTAGRSLPYTLGPGTINTILLVDADLTPAAMVNAVITTTEAKTALLGERAVKTRQGYRATGTSTDAVVIACTGRGAAQPYAGPATPIGWLIGRAVQHALQEALDAYRP